MEIQSHINSIFGSICYAFSGIMLDPGDKWDGFNNVSSVLLSHAHIDHIYGLNKIFEECIDCVVYTNEYGKEMLQNEKMNMSKYHETPFVFQYPESIITVNDGDEIVLGDGMVAKAVFTPGHNPSCITWIVGDALFTGDSYIPGIKTVTNLPGGNKQQATESEEIIRKLSVGRTIYPGHNIVNEK